MAQGVASWDALPGDVILRVLHHHAGDVRTLCAAACVGRAWREAATVPSLWTQLKALPLRTAVELTDERLAALIARARGCLEALDVSNALRLTDEGLRAALLQPHALVAFTAGYGCDQLTAQGVARALAAQNGRMRLLVTRGLACAPNFPLLDDERGGGWYEECTGIIAALQALVAPDGVGLDGMLFCEHPCARLCGAEDICSSVGCDAVVCEEHREADYFMLCSGCFELFCDDCLTLRGQCADCDLSSSDESSGDDEE